MGDPHLLEVLDEDELREVVIGRSLGKVFTTRTQPALFECFTAEGLVLRAESDPGRTPVGPALD
jgi:hypothetical protein